MIAAHEDGLWMQTATGKLWRLNAPRPEDVDLMDLAIGLAWTNRYQGHAGGYSDATHCRLVSEWLEAQGQSASICMAGHLHDAHEAYLGDFIRPVQLVLSLEIDALIPEETTPYPLPNLFGRALSALKLRHDAAILKGLGLDSYLQVDMLHEGIVKEADRRILRDERDQLWSGDPPAPWLDDEIVEPLGIEVVREPPEVAMVAWMSRYQDLRIRLGGR